MYCLAQFELKKYLKIRILRSFFFYINALLSFISLNLFYAVCKKNVVNLLNIFSPFPSVFFFI